MVVQNVSANSIKGNHVGSRGIGLTGVVHVAVVLTTLSLRLLVSGGLDLAKVVVQNHVVAFAQYTQIIDKLAGNLLSHGQYPLC